MGATGPTNTVASRSQMTRDPILGLKLLDLVLIIVMVLRTFSCKKKKC